MSITPVSLDKNVHRYISLKLCFTPEINSTYFGTGECVGIGQAIVLRRNQSQYEYYCFLYLVMRRRKTVMNFNYNRKLIINDQKST